jgi:hypothetical protein
MESEEDYKLKSELIHLYLSNNNSKSIQEGLLIEKIFETPLIAKPEVEFFVQEQN